jgi:hypothetical protein
VAGLSGRPMSGSGVICGVLSYFGLTHAWGECWGFAGLGWSKRWSAWETYEGIAISTQRLAWF